MGRWAAACRDLGRAPIPSCSCTVVQSIAHPGEDARRAARRSRVDAGDSYDAALAESIIGLFKTEVIQRKGPWRHLEAVEFATLTWVDGSTRVACSNRLATCRPPSMKRTTMLRL